MSKFKDVMTNYLDSTTDINDQRLIKEAIQLMDAKPILTNEIMSVLNEIFIALKNKHSIRITKDFDTFDFMVVLVEQQQPIIENDHNVKPLIEELQDLAQQNSLTNVELLTLKFLDSCEHVEENEIILLEKIMDLIDNNWVLTPISMSTYKENKVKSSHIVPKQLKKVLTNNNRNN